MKASVWRRRAGKLIIRIQDLARQLDEVPVLSEFTQRRRYRARRQQTSERGRETGFCHFPQFRPPKRRLCAWSIEAHIPMLPKRRPHGLRRQLARSGGSAVWSQSFRRPLSAHRRQHSAPYHFPSRGPLNRYLRGSKILICGRGAVEGPRHTRHEQHAHANRRSFSPAKRSWPDAERHARSGSTAHDRA